MPPKRNCDGDDEDHTNKKAKSAIHDHQEITAIEQLSNMRVLFDGGLCQNTITCSSFISIVTYIDLKNIYVIGDYSFRNFVNLEYVCLDEKLHTIGKSAFSNCKSLKSLDLPISCRHIRSYAFLKSGVQTIDLSHVEILESYAFCECIDLKNIGTLNCDTISEYCFAKCVNLGQDIFIGNTCTGIGKNAFAGSLISSVFMSDSVTHIEMGCFRSCFNLQSLHVSNNVKMIPDSCCFSCSKLYKVHMNNIGEIQEYAFAQCTSLVTFDCTQYCKKIGKYAFVDCTSLISICIPECVRIIREYTFAECVKLSNVTGSAQKIETYAFYKCGNLKSYDFSRTGEICRMAFPQCGLKSIDFSKSTKRKKLHIHDWAFDHCKNLQRVISGNKLNISIAANCFYDCPLLKTIDLRMCSERVRWYNRMSDKPKLNINVYFEYENYMNNTRWNVCNYVDIREIYIIKSQHLNHQHYGKHQYKKLQFLLNSTSKVYFVYNNFEYMTMPIKRNQPLADGSCVKFLTAKDDPDLYLKSSIFRPKILLTLGCIIKKMIPGHDTYLIMKHIQNFLST